MRSKPTFEKLVSVSTPTLTIPKRPAVDLTISAQFNLFNEVAGAEMLRQSKSHANHEALQSQLKDAAQEQGSSVAAIRMAMDLGNEKRENINEMARSSMEDVREMQSRSAVHSAAKTLYNMFLGSRQQQSTKDTANLIQPTPIVTHDVEDIFYDAREHDKQRQLVSQITVPEPSPEPGDVPPGTVETGRMLGIKSKNKDKGYHEYRRQFEDA